MKVTDLQIGQRYSRRDYPTENCWEFTKQIFDTQKNQWCYYFECHHTPKCTAKKTVAAKDLEEWVPADPLAAPLEVTE